jgi:glycosyltransferase involved in cell wall biosynthesis
MFSIVIPLYNKEAYIKRCLKSVYSQSFQDFEVIVIDDGSTDKGAQIIKDEYPEVILIQQSNQGVSKARNTGIAKSKNKYIAFLDADDAWHPQYLNYVKEVIESNQSANIVGGHYSNDISSIKLTSNALDYIEIKDYFKSASKNTIFFTSATVVRRQVIIDNRITFNSTLKGGEDLDFWFKVNLVRGGAFYIKNTLVYYSDEDIMQATRSLPDLNQTLVGTIEASYRNYYENHSDLRKFISQYILLNLFPYFYRRDSNKLASEILRNIPCKSFLLSMAYKLPLSMGIRMINNSRSRKYFRLYLKFIIKISRY